MPNGNIFGTELRLPIPRQIDINPEALARILALPEVARQEAKTAAFESLAKLPSDISNIYISAKEAKRKEKELKLKELQQELFSKPLKSVAPSLAKRFPELGDLPLSQFKEMSGVIGLLKTKEKAAKPSILEKAAESSILEKERKGEFFNQEEVDKFSPLGYQFQEIPTGRLGSLFGKKFKFTGEQPSSKVGPSAPVLQPNIQRTKRGLTYSILGP